MEFERVKYYTIRLEEEEDIFENDSEADKFFKRFGDQPKRASQGAELIYNSIIEIGKRGASERYFRLEKRAEALPPANNILVELGGSEEQKANNLRLYCLRLSDEVVVLLNGDWKTANKAQDCPQVGPHFRLANKCSKNR